MNQDPRITSYAVGELLGRKREIFEAEMAASDDLQKEVDAMCDVSKQFQATAKVEERFAPTERAELIAKCVRNQRSRKFFMLPVKIIGFSVAAALVMFAGLFGLVLIVGQSGPGPWANAAYYPHYLDGEYIGIISGPNTAGVVKFTMDNGAPEFVTRDGAPSEVEERSTFVVFSEGRRRKGEASTALNYDDGSVTGLLSSRRRTAAEEASEKLSGSENMLAGAKLDQSPPTPESVAVTNMTIEEPITGIQGEDRALQFNQETSAGFTMQFKFGNMQSRDLEGFGRLILPAEMEDTATESGKTVDFRVIGSATDPQKQIGPATSPR